MKTTVMKIMVTAALLGVPPAMNADSIVSFAEIRQNDAVQVTDVWANMPELTAVEESLFTAPTPEKTVLTITALETRNYTTTEATAWKRPMNARIATADVFVFVQDSVNTMAQTAGELEDDEVVRLDYKQSALG